MKNEFIPYEQALELKELGFDEPCFAFYGMDGDYIIGIDEVRFDTISNYDFNSRTSEESNSCSAPLYQQAFRWFRDKHKLCGDIRFYERFRFHYSFFVHDIKYCEQSDTIYIDYESYEEAELACLKKLLEIAWFKKAKALVD